MPELPEVETVLRTLEKSIKDLEIIDIDILYKPIVSLDEETFKNKLIHEHFRSFKRRGKYLLFEMDNITLVSHLRMEGKYFILDNDVPINKHDHVIFKLSNNKQLRYNDVRKFGRMELIEKGDYKNFKDLGPEPFSEDFNLEYARAYLRKLNKPIKEVLLDQSFVAGIGNIYADEIAYLVGLNPLTKANRLSDKDINLLIEATRKVLNKAILEGGTTIRSYTSSLGVTGRFQQELNVHTKEYCPKCGSKIKKIRVASRGTYYCENCQKYKKRIAVTGTIGSGKSAFMKIVKDNGYHVFDADLTNKELLEKNNEGYLKVKEAFKECFKDDELDKKALAELVFNDENERLKLESIMHPLILEKLLSDENELLICEIPLLFEVSWDKYFDETVLVVTNEDIILKRLKKRGLSLKEAKLRIENQMNVNDKIKKADVVIYNNSSLANLKKKVWNYLKNIC